MEYIINRFRYVCKKSNEMNKDEVESYINAFNKVFVLNYNSEWFKWKYSNNIYGYSYLAIVYNNEEKVIAIRGFWRNDIYDNVKSFQPVDTGVLRKYRRMNIFTQMNKIVLENIKNELVYNFPNSKSLPGYLKLDWKLKYRYNLHIVFDLKRVLNLGYLKKIDDNYLLWRFCKNPVKKYFYIKKENIYFLLSHKKYNIYYVLGIFEKKYIKYFKKVLFPIMFYYSTTKSKNYFLNNKCNLVIRNCEDRKNIDIPIFRGDTI